MTLPPGQYEIDHFPRFGMSRFARRFPREPQRIELQLRVAGGEPVDAGAAWAGLPRTEQLSDFHCVTSWSRRGLRWSGVRFRDLLALLAPRQNSADPASALVVLHGEDGYRAALPLADLLADDVLLADRLDGAPLGIAHGAPLRLVAPAHYGYKSVKHLKRIELLADGQAWQPPGWRFLVHPRGRVALEERGVGAPGWLLCLLYRPLVRSNAALFARALARHRGEPG